MKTSPKATNYEDSRVLLDTLKKAVAHALEKKRRLGQYAVIWKNGKPVRIGTETGGMQ